MREALVQSARDNFRQRFGYEPLLAAAPGRINIIGEHIDYNDGLVLPMAIDRYVICGLGRANPGRWRFWAIDQDDFVDVDSLEAIPLKGWQAYVVGMIREIQQLGHDLVGLDLVITGDVPVGSGLSSSAALEMSVVTVLDAATSAGITTLDKALLGQKVEHEYVGVRCGIMDQYASAFGREGHAILVDCQGLTHRYIPLVLKDHHFVLCNSGVDHALASSQYNVRRASCEDGWRIITAHYPSVRSFREVDASMLVACRAAMPVETYQRCAYVVAEMSRVNAVVTALEQQDLPTLGRLLREGHQGLSEAYEVSCIELDYLVEVACAYPGVLGARMMGGGFGGCTLNLVRDDVGEAFVEHLSQRYRERFDLDLETYSVQSSDGAGLLGSGLS